MTRIVGTLYGVEGPLNGRLFVKAGAPFIGAPATQLVFKIENGLVDIDLAPCPAGAPYMVDWRAIGDTRRLEYAERWRVPPVAEIALDEARGLIRASAQKASRAEAKGSLLETAMLRGEANALREKLAAVEGENASLLRRLSQLEGNAAAHQAQAASLAAELSKAKQSLETGRKPTVIEKQRVVERLKTREETAEEMAAYEQQVILLREENEKLSQSLKDTLSLSTHFANLHAQIDRLNQEKRQLLFRIEELKSPVRTTSSLRNEAIANLDKLTSG